MHENSVPAVTHQSSCSMIAHKRGRYQRCAKPLKSLNRSGFPTFPDFGLRSPEVSQKSGTSRSLTRESPELRGIIIKWTKTMFPFPLCVKNACLYPCASQKPVLRIHCSAKRNGCRIWTLKLVRIQVYSMRWHIIYFLLQVQTLPVILIFTFLGIKLLKKWMVSFRANS